MERKHALQQEEERRQEQERIKEAERLRERERERVDPKKIAAQKQAIEKRRLEIAKKGEQKGSTMGAKLRSANNTVSFKVVPVQRIANSCLGTSHGTRKDVATSPPSPGRDGYRKTSFESQYSRKCKCECITKRTLY
jgi:hypothetical protein